MAEKTPKLIAAVRIVKPDHVHTHAGRDYTTGAELDCERLGLSQQDAAWLIAAGIAEEIPAK